MILHKVTDLNFTCRKCGGRAKPFFVPARNWDDFWAELEKDENVFCEMCAPVCDLVKEVPGEAVIYKYFSDIACKGMN